MHNKYRAYSNATQTAPKTRQVVMLYDAAIRNLQQAREAMREHRIEDRYKLLTKAAEIIFGLQGCLDFERGGEVARVLYDFYAGMDARIIMLHRTNDEAMCGQLITEMKAMRDSWDSIDQAETSGAPMPPPAAKPSATEEGGVTLSA